MACVYSSGSGTSLLLVITMILLQFAQRTVVADGGARDYGKQNIQAHSDPEVVYCLCLLLLVWHNGFCGGVVPLPDMPVYGIDVLCASVMSNTTHG